MRETVGPSHPRGGYRTKVDLLFYVGVELIYNVVFISGVQQSDSVLHTR